MTREQKKILWIAVGASLLIILTMGTPYLDVLKTFLPSIEGFSPTPIWDYKQWSWGYGTFAGSDQNHKPAGTITRGQAMTDLLKVVQDHYNYLSPLITRKLSGNQWAALLSFSYNLGKGNADNLVDNINSGDDAALKTQWMKYVNAGGHVNQGLVTRRGKEIALWQKA